MNKTIPVWVLVITSVLLILLFISIWNWKSGSADEKISQLRDSVAIFDARAAIAKHAADSSEFLAVVYEDLANKALAETVFIHDQHEKIRYTISHLDASGGLGLLSKNLQGN